MLQSEVVSHLIQQIYRGRPNLKLPKTAVHKLLFKVRVALPEDDPIRKNLPFYWYKYGPYSEVVESTIDTLKLTGILQEEKTDKGVLLLKPTHRLTDSVNVLEDVSATVEKLVKEIDPFHIEHFVNQVYRDDAPYEFMPRYKMDYLVQFKKYLTSHPANQCTLNRFLGDSISPDVDRLENIIYDCEAELVEEPLFDEFNDEFTSYVSGAGKAFDMIRKDEGNAYPITKMTSETSINIWLTFAKGVRILDKGHDEYYDGKLEQWGQEYRISFLNMIPKVRAFNRNIRESGRHTIPREPDERSKRVLSSLIEGYLS